MPARRNRPDKCRTTEPGTAPNPPHDWTRSGGVTTARAECRTCGKTKAVLVGAV